MKMAMMSAQIRYYAAKQMVALDTLLVGKEEMKTIMDHAKTKQADVDRLQQPLPFKGGNKVKNYFYYTRDENNVPVITGGWS